MSSEVVALPELLAPVRAGLIAMREILSAELSDQGPVGERVAHISRFRGKELRAALVLLAGQAVDNRDPELPQVAAVLELIHLATLVHDDVLDGADLRRNLPSVHVAWDEQTAILLGDMLYSRAFHLSTRLRSILAASLLSLAAQRICAGEMEQAALRYRFDLDQDTYESIAAAKTAELYAAACELGARYKGEPGAWSDKEERKALELKAFGRELGLAFQIMDDVLDVIGKEVEVGKRVGNDVEDGKVTLPILWTYQNSSETVQARIRLAYQDPSVTDRLQALREACDLEAGLAFARRRAQELLHSALGRLEAIPPSAAREALQRIAEYVLYRKK